MEFRVNELLDLLVRWVHVIAGIMWIGNSLLFNWLDRNLTMPAGADERVQGQIWLVHSGAFYDVVKKQLAPNELPPVMHWFKWQSYTTWMSGVALLVVVYYTTAGAFMIDPNVRDLSPHAAVAIGAGTLVCGFVGVRPDLAFAARATRAACRWGGADSVARGHLCAHAHAERARRVRSRGRDAGTIMSGNVFFHIIPSQRELVAATRAGNVQDLRLSKHAKQRSIHNNYMTFPVLVLMVSNHFPFAWGSERRGLVLIVLIVGGAAVRHVLNIRFTLSDWVALLVATVTSTVGVLYFLLSFPPMPTERPHDDGPPVPFAMVQAIVGARCLPCHATHATERDFPAPPVRFETPVQIQALSERIYTRVVIQRTMPLLNHTHMTEDERHTLERWYDQGASIER